jgi:fructose-1,6-bisphosphatase/inositol monophosphatase family enzyme
VLLIREAGGQVFTLDGLVWHASRRIAAATPVLASMWLQLLVSEGT